MPRRFLAVLPSLVTLCGLALTLAWLAGAPLVLGLLGWSLDAVDGRVARALGAVSPFGKWLDWHVDVLVCVLLCPRWALPMLALWLAFASAQNIKASGRSLLTVLFVVLAR